MKFVDCGKVKINKDLVMSVEREDRFYVNGSDHFLIVRMVNGDIHKLHHTDKYGGLDLYEVERLLMEE